jgi:hypothetical protein
LFSTGPALAAEGESVAPDLGRNAALTYWRAFAMSPVMTDDELKIFNPRPGTEPKTSPEKNAALVKRWGQALQLMHQAAAVSQCDWGIDYEKEGLHASLPHFSKAWTLARAAAFRAKYLWEKGQRKDAAEDLRATVVMARHVGNDGRETDIALFMQIAIEGLVQDAAAQLLTDREAADLFADVLGDLSNGPSALLSKNAILAEKRVRILWMRHRAESEPDIGKKLAKDLGPAESETRKEVLIKLSQTQNADILKWLDEELKQYDDMAAIADLPFQEFQTRWAALDERIKASKNPFSELILPYIVSVRKEEERYRIRWAMVRAAIEIRREGESALTKVTDPHDGKPFQYTALEGGAFELKSTMLVRGRQFDQPLVMTFGRPPAGKD